MARHRDITEDLPKSKFTRQNIREGLSIFRYLKPYRGMFAAGLLFIALGSLTTLAFPYLLKAIVDSSHSGAGFSYTPGQIALIIHSENEYMLYISDAFLHPLHIEKINWQTNYDMDHAKAKQSRVKLLELAYKDNMLVNAFHFDFPGLGRIHKFENNWTWKRLESPGS